MPMWSEALLAAVAQEFSDVSDLSQTVRVVVRLLMAALLGGLLGWERETQGKAAGVRTHMLVCMGASLFVVVPEQAGMTFEDVSRVIQGITAGVGFLCAGTIIKGRASADVQGLTTAAGIWLTTAVGVACGLGRESTALLGTVLALATLKLLPWLAASLQKRTNQD